MAKFYVFYHHNISHTCPITSTSVVTPLVSHLNYNSPPSVLLASISFPFCCPKDVIQRPAWVTVVIQKLPTFPHCLKNQVQTLCLSFKTQPFSELCYLRAQCSLYINLLLFLQSLSASSGAFPLCSPLVTTPEQNSSRWSCFIFHAEVY